MSKRRKQASLDPGVRNGIRTVIVKAESQRVAPTIGTPQPFTYNNQVEGVHDPSAVVKIPPLPNGWRRPGPYRVFAERTMRYGFEYTYNQPTTTWVDRGITDTAGAFGPASNLVYFGTKLSGGLRVPDVPVSVLNQAIAEAKNKLQNQDLNILTSLGEFRETVNFISTLLLKQDQILSGFINALRRSNISRYEVHKAFDAASRSRRRNRARKRAVERVNAKAKADEKYRNDVEARYEEFNRTLDSVWSLWLAYSFGLNPLVSDIKAAAVAAHEKLAKPGAHVKVLRCISYRGDEPPRGPGYDVWVANGSLTLGAECELRYRVNDAHLSLIASLGLLNPAGLAWELTPYSFLIDWFIPVSNWLSSLTADVGLVFESGYTNTKSFSSYTYTTCKKVGAKGKLPSVNIQNVCQKRDSLVTTPFPGLYVSYKSPFSASHLVSISALVGLFISNGGR